MVESLHREITLYTSPETIVLKSPSENLMINRRDHTITFPKSIVDPRLISGDGTKIHGILGGIRLLYGYYLAVITHVKKVGLLFANHEVYRITGVEWLPLNDTVNHTSTDEAIYLKLLNTVVKQEAFYFSYTYDMTKSVQNWYLLETQEVLYKNADRHFFWNMYLSKDFMEANASRWIIPVIRGFVEIQNCKLNSGKSIKFAMISRLGTRRVGTRYNIRGIDVQGNAANYAETEQIIETETDILSFMQIRGSIPLYWSQKPNLKYKPQIKIGTKHDSTSGFQLHFKDQLERYKNVVIVNLVDMKGSEKMLADAYETEYKKFGNDKVRYIQFDFHKKCKNMNYEVINELVSQIENNIEDYGYFHYDMKSKTVKRTQDGIIRVNCIDCLDRTNVVESVFGRHVITKQLRELGLISESEQITDFKHLEFVFKNTWADNGDALSYLYAGTGSLKSDFTRTGKRSFLGLYNDGMNSIRRYFLNNFSDGNKQDAINLFLGKYVVDPEASSPFITNADPLLTFLKYSFFVSLLITAFSTSKIINDPFKSLKILRALFWITLTLILYFLILRKGRSFVNRPRLKEVKKKNK
jgi:hypothetical protein